MNQEEIGKYIKELRIKNKLTQEEFAKKLHVTAQAVSKWELGKSLPDISLLNEISRKYNVEIDEILNGERKKKTKINMIVLIVFLIIVGLIITLLLFKNKDDYQFRNVTSLCDEYKIAGIAAYDTKKSSIYISNIEYCGKEEINVEYKSITCTLYESFNDITKRISTCEEKNNITLNDYLKNISIKVDNYDTVCKNFDSSIIYLEIDAKGANNYQHKIPLKISTCD